MCRKILFANFHGRLIDTNLTHREFQTRTKLMNSICSQSCEAHLTMSKTDELKSKLSTLSEEEELIFLYYYCEVSKHSLLVDGETGSYAQYQNVSKVAKSLFLPFEMSRQKFDRSAPDKPSCSKTLERPTYLVL